MSAHIFFSILYKLKAWQTHQLSYTYALLENYVVIPLSELSTSQLCLSLWHSHVTFAIFPTSTYHFDYVLFNSLTSATSFM